MLSHVQLFASLLTVARQAPLSMGLFRQEIWSGLPCPFPGDLPDPEIEPMSLVSPASLPNAPPRSQQNLYKEFFFFGAGRFVI